jgi:hypothetical protein
VSQVYVNVKVTSNVEAGLTRDSDPTASRAILILINAIAGLSPLPRSKLTQA